MAFIETPNGIEVVLEYDNYGQIAQNVFHVRNDTGTDVGVLTNTAITFRDWWLAEQQAWTNEGVSLRRILVTDISVEGGPGIEFTDSLPASGDLVEHHLPQNVTVAVKLATGQTGRSNRGRTYIVGIGESALVGNGTISAGAVSGLTANYNQLIEDCSTNDTPLCVLSLQHNNAPRTEGVLTEITAASVNSTLDSQRRRLPERGI